MGEQPWNWSLADVLGESSAAVSDVVLRLVTDPGFMKEVVFELGQNVRPDQALRLVAMLSQGCEMCSGDPEAIRQLRACRALALSYEEGRPS